MSDSARLLEEARPPLGWFHVQKEYLRAGSATSSNPQYPSYDVVYRRDYEALAAELQRLREALEQADRFIADAIEGTGCDEDELLADDPDNVWCRIVAANWTLRAALAGSTAAQQEETVARDET